MAMTETPLSDSRFAAAPPGTAESPPPAGGTANWLLVLPGTIWMAVFVGIPVASIIVFSFWRSGFAGLVPDYNVKNYVNLLSSHTFWNITLWTYEVVLMALAGVITLSYPAAYAIWRVLRDER